MRACSLAEYEDAAFGRNSPPVGPSETLGAKRLGLPCQMVTTARSAQSVTGKISLSGSQRKTAHAIRVNVCRQITEDGFESSGMLTLTAGDWVCIEHGVQIPLPRGACPHCGLVMPFVQVKDAGEASKRVHGLLRRFVGRFMRRGVIVTERHKSGAIHFHIVGSVINGAELFCGLDIRTGFDFAAVAAGDYRSASPGLRAIWKMLREELPAFGFGRAELLPLKSSGEQVGSYVSKYIEKNIGARGEDDRGKKLVRYFGWKKRHLKPNDFAWATARATAWRTSARELSALVGVESRAEASECFGSRWAWHLSGVMNAVAGNDQVACGQELSSFHTRDAARQFVLLVADRRWVERRSRWHGRDVRGASWCRGYRTIGERRQLSLKV